MEAITELSRSQVRARDRFYLFLADKVRDSERGTVPPLVLTRFEVKLVMEVGVVWITAELERTGMSESSVLRFLDHEYWHILIGKRGGVKVHMSPKCYHQFKGQYAFGMFFAR